MRAFAWLINCRVVVALALVAVAQTTWAQLNAGDAHPNTQLVIELASLLERNESDISLEMFEIKGNISKPSRNADSLKTFESVRRAAITALRARSPAPDGWSDREKLLLAECIAAQAGSVLSARTLDKQTPIKSRSKLEYLRKINIAAAEWLSDAKRRELAEFRELQTASSPVQGLLPQARLSEIEEGADVVPWFDRRIAFLAVSAASGFALEPVASTLPTGLMDKRESAEKFLPWSQRQCARIMFLRSAHVDYLEVNPVELREADTPTKHIAAGKLVLRNVGARRLVGSTLFVMLSDAEGGAFDPRIEQVLLLPFDLEPLQKTDSLFEVEFRKGRGRIVQFLPVGPDESPTAAEPIGDSRNIATCVERALEAGDKPPFMGVLVRLAMEAPREFRELAVEPLEPGRRTTTAKLQVPNAKETIIQKYGRFATAAATLYAGDSKVKALDAFNNTVSSLRSFCGNSVGELSSNDGDVSSEKLNLFIKMFSPHSELSLNLNQSRKAVAGRSKGQYLVTLEISPHFRVFP